MGGWGLGGIGLGNAAQPPSCAVFSALHPLEPTCRASVQAFMPSGLCRIPTACLPPPSATARLRCTHTLPRLMHGRITLPPTLHPAPVPACPAHSTHTHTHAYTSHLHPTAPTCTQFLPTNRRRPPRSGRRRRGAVRRRGLLHAHLFHPQRPAGAEPGPWRVPHVLQQPGAQDGAGGGPRGPGARLGLARSTPLDRLCTSCAHPFADLMHPGTLPCAQYRLGLGGTRARCVGGAHEF